MNAHVLRQVVIMLVLFSFFAGGWSRIAAVDDPKIFRQITAVTGSVGRYEKFEAKIDLDTTVKNPYDPAEIKVDLEFKSPSGRSATVPGFFFRDYKFALTTSEPITESISATGDSSWRGRFTPDEVGEYTYTVSVVKDGQTSTSTPRKFTVTKSDSHGMLRVSKRDSHYLEFDDGTPFFGIGLNMGWYGDGKLADYQRWMSAFSAAGGNMIRVWMAPWGFSPEWNDTKLGNYDLRQDRAYELDKLFEMAAAHGIYIQLVLLNHGQFNTVTNPEWNDNPYNAANGGPLKNPEDFATNADAIKLWQQRLRYVAARYAYSPNLMAWEWWNEVNWTPIANPSLLAPWMKQSDEVLKSLDPYNHLRTHSGSALNDETVWSQVSITVAHIYEAPDWAFTLVDSARKWSAKYQRPFLLAEFGYNESPKFDPMGVRLRIGLWAGLMGGGLGTGQFWWWDSYIYPNKMYQPFKGITAFVKGEDLAAHGFKPAQAKSSKISLADVYGMQGSDSALLWVISGKFSDPYYKRLYQDNLISKVANPEQVTFPEVSGLKVTVKGLTDGAYAVEWWDTQAGTILKTDSAKTADGSLVIDAPTFQTDLAVKIRRAS